MNRRRMVRRRKSQTAPAELLEYRTLLASVMDDGTTLQIQLEADEHVSVVSNGDHYTFRSDSKTFTDTGVFDAGDFSGFGTDTLTLDNFAGYFTVSITDTAAGASVQFDDSGANLYQHDFHVTLDNGAASPSVVFNGATQFDQDELIVSTDRAILMEPDSSLTTNDGDIVLRAENSASGSEISGGILLVSAEIRTAGTGDIWLEGTASAAGQVTAGRIGVRAEQGIRLRSTSGDALAGTITVIGNGAAGSWGNIGVELKDAEIVSNRGAITINGQGGDSSGHRNYGVLLTSSDIQSTGTGLGAASITVRGSGGAGTDENHGILLQTTSNISSVEGDILLAGTTGNVTGDSNTGVRLTDGVVVESTGVGPGAATITLDGTGGNGVNYNQGVSMQGSLNEVRSVDGNISIVGRGGANAGSKNDGVHVLSGRIISTGVGDHAARITFDGVGGSGDEIDSAYNSGVHFESENVAVDSRKGILNITGVGGNSSTGVYVGGGVSLTVGEGNLVIDGEAPNFGVNVSTAAINTTGDGDVFIRGDSTRGTGVFLSGNALIASLATDETAGSINIIGGENSGSASGTGVMIGGKCLVSTAAGAIDVNGTGGLNSHGVQLWTESRIQSIGSGDHAGAVTVTGVGRGNGDGIVLGGTRSSAHKIASIVSDIELIGTGGGGFGSHGILALHGVTVESTGVGANAANIRLHGSSTDDGGVGSYNHGIRLVEANVRSVDGDILLRGTAGSGAGGGDAGVILDRSIVTTSGQSSIAGHIRIDGTGGAGGHGRHGVVLRGAGTAVTAAAGDILVRGIGGDGGGSHGVSMHSTDYVSSTWGSAVIEGVAGLAAAARDVRVYNAGFTSSLHGHPGVLVSDSVQFVPNDAAAPLRPRTIEAMTGDTVTVEFKHFSSPGFLRSSSDLMLARSSEIKFTFGGNAAGAGGGFHDQILTAGRVDIESDVSLSAQWLPAWEPTPGASLTIIRRESGTGTFDGLPEGATLPDFFGATISYIGGDGNDVVLTLPDSVPALAPILRLDEIGSLGVTVLGETADDQLGSAVSPAGDVNGDGHDDFLVNAVYADGLDDQQGSVGNVYLIYGGHDLPKSLTIDEIRGSRGVVFYGATERDATGRSVSAADVNGDGFSDVIIGAGFRDGVNGETHDTGAVYLVWGGRSLPSAIDLRLLGSHGTTIYGAGASASFGKTVASIGDFNGDGIADFAAAADGEENHGVLRVIFGRLDWPEQIDLGTATSGVVTFRGDNAADWPGSAIQSLGDINGDSIDDILVGATGGDGPGESRPLAGEAYVVLGSRDFQTENDFADAATYMSRIYGAEEGDASLGARFWLAGAADVNGDGLNDIVYGAASASGLRNTRPGAGEVYIIYGTTQLPASIDLADPNAADVTIFGAEPQDAAGSAVSLIGDVNGDGLADLAIGAPGGDGAGNTEPGAGETYLLLGRRDYPSTIDLRAPGAADLLIFGGAAGDRSGSAVSAAGDVDRDGLDDLLIGAHCADLSPTELIDRGAAYLIYGSSLVTPAVPALIGPAGPIDETRPTIRWNESVDAESYEVWLELIGGSNNPIANPTVTTTSFIPTADLTLGRYRAWVRANRADGSTSKWMSRTFSVTGSTTVYTNDFHSEAARPQLTWDGVPGATGYRVYVYNSTLQNVVFDEVLTETTWTPAADLSFGRHRVWVQPLGASNFRGSWSAPTDVQIGPLALTPIAPTFETQPNFTWTGPAGATTYDLYLFRRGGQAEVFTDLTTTSFTPAESLAAGSYRWWIRGKADNGRATAWSPVAEFSIGGRTVVTSPTGTISDFTPTIQWQAVTGAGSYEIYLHHEQTQTVVHRENDLQSTSYTTDPLAEGDYRVWVRTYEDDGTAGPWSAAQPFTLTYAASSLTATPLYDASPSISLTPQLTWTADSGAASFNLYLTNGTDIREVNEVTSTSWTPATPLSNDTQTWTWYVQAVNADGAAGPWSSEATIDLTGRAILLGPTNSTDDRTPTIEWTAVTGAVRYSLQADNTMTGQVAIIREDALTESSFTPAADLPAGRYRVWVRAIGGEGTYAPWSLPLFFDIT
ncbi:MAG: hypothetical protein Fues2KO_00610 [Fuerstiella sp.]